MDPSANKSADQTDSKKDPNMDKFFENINGLSNRSRIELARSCGKKIVTRERSATASIVAQAAFYQCLPTSVERWKEGRYAFCGCISAFMKRRANTRDFSHEIQPDNIIYTNILRIVKHMV